MRRASVYLKQADPVLGEIIERVGPCKIQYAEPDFETLVRSIVFQQLNGKAARAIFARFLATGDLGIRSAIRRAYRLWKLPTPARVEKLGAKWHPHCSVACWYLWRSTETVI